MQCLLFHYLLMDIWVGPTCLYWKYYNSIMNRSVIIALFLVLEEQYLVFHYSVCPALGWHWGDIPCLRAKEKPQQDDRRGTVTFKVKSQTSQRCSEGTNKTLCTPGPREWVSDFHKRLNQTWLWVFECILQRHSSAVTCVELGTLAATDLKDMVWHAFIWRISPLDPV